MAATEVNDNSAFLIFADVFIIIHPFRMLVYSINYTYLRISAYALNLTQYIHTIQNKEERRKISFEGNIFLIIITSSSFSIIG